MSMKRVYCLVLLLFVLTPAWAAGVKVSTDWVANNRAHIVLVDMSVDPLQYLRFHVPGAIRIEYDQLIYQRKKDKVKLRVPDQQLIKLLGLSGIKRSDHVVIYDDMGGLNAGRLLWELERIGHPKVSVMDGGLVAWIREGREVSASPVERPAVDYGEAGKGRSNEIDLAGIKSLSPGKETVLLDVRTLEEYQGHPRVPRSGHIPGALWWHWEDNLDIGAGFRLHAADTLRQRLAQLGVQEPSAGQEVVLYCRSGHRAAQAYYTLRSLGYDRIKLYDGSMSEYQRDPAAPLKLGQQP